MDQLSYLKYQLSKLNMVYFNACKIYHLFIDNIKFIYVYKNGDTDNVLRDRYPNIIVIFYILCLKRLYHLILTSE